MPNSTRPRAKSGTSPSKPKLDLVECLVKIDLMEIAISEFKAKCIQLLKSAAASDEELVVTLRGKPMAKITGIQSCQQRQLGGQPDAVAGDLPDAVLLASDLENDWES